MGGGAGNCLVTAFSVDQKSLNIGQRVLDIGHGKSVIGHRTVNIGRKLSFIGQRKLHIGQGLSFIGHILSCIGQLSSHTVTETSRFSTLSRFHWTQVYLQRAI
jgi:hypothetical protein